MAIGCHGQIKLLGQRLAADILFTRIEFYTQWRTVGLAADCQLNRIAPRQDQRALRNDRFPPGEYRSNRLIVVQRLWTWVAQIPFKAVCAGRCGKLLRR